MQTRTPASAAGGQVVTVLGVQLGLESRAVAVVKRRPSAQIRQPEPLPAIAAELVPDHREQTSEVPDQDLASVTDLPSAGSEIERERPDLAEQRPGYLILEAHDVGQR